MHPRSLIMLLYLILLLSPCLPLLSRRVCVVLCFKELHWVEGTALCWQVILTDDAAFITNTCRRAFSFRNLSNVFQQNSSPPSKPSPQQCRPELPLIPCCPFLHGFVRTDWSPCQQRGANTQASSSPGPHPLVVGPPPRIPLPFLSEPSDKNAQHSPHFAASASASVGRRRCPQQCRPKPRLLLSPRPARPDRSPPGDVS